MVHCCNIPFHALSLTFPCSYRVRHLASFQSLARVAHAHYIIGRIGHWQIRVGHAEQGNVI